MCVGTRLMQVVLPHACAHGIHSRRACSSACMRTAYSFAEGVQLRMRTCVMFIRGGRAAPHAHVHIEERMRTHTHARAVLRAGKSA